MKISLLTLLSLLTFSLNIFSQGWTASSVVNCTDNIEPRYSVIDNYNNVFILYAFQGTLTTHGLVSFGVRDVILEKRNSNGSLLWYKRIGGIKNDNAGGMTIDSEGNIYLLINSYGNCRFTPTDSVLNTGSMDVIMAKFNNNGTFEWAKAVCTSSTLQGSSNLNYDKFNQRLIALGYYNDSLKIGSQPSDLSILLGNNDGFTSHFIASFDLSGIRQWSKRILGTYNLSRLTDIEESENGYYIGGYFLNNMTFDLGTISSYSNTINAYDVFLYKTDFNGNGEWIRRIRGSNVENFRSLATDEFDNVYILGNSNSTNILIDSTSSAIKTNSVSISSYDTYICKYNRSGTLQWFLRKGSTSKDIYNDFVIGKNIIYATGYFTDKIVFNNDTLKTSQSFPDPFLAAFNSIGDPIAGVSVKGTGGFEDAGSMINMDANSRAYVTGYYKSLQIQIGSQIYTNDNNKNDLFFAIYKHPFKAVITDEQMVSCNGLSDGMLTVTPYFGRPPYTYSWSHDPALNSNIAENLAAGTYTVTVRDANDSITSIDGIVTQSPELDIAGIITPVSCFNGSDGAINITPAGGSGSYNYFWTSLDGSGVEPLIQDQAGLSRGTYSVKVSDQHNCTDSTSFLVTEPTKITYSGTVVTKIIIPPGNNGSVNLNATGGNTPFTFAWTGPNGYTASSEDIGNLADAGLYNVSITDAKNCLTDTTFTVIDNFTFVAEISRKTDVLCNGANDGTATVRVLNGTLPYSYQWSDGVSLNDSLRTGMAPGLYVVTVTDGALKTSQASVRIYQPDLPLSIVLDHENLRCNGDNSGVIDLTVSGGTLPYAFEWSNGYTGEDLVNIPADVYLVTVTDGNNCQVQENRQVYEPDAIGLTISVSGDILCHGDRTAIATANATGGNPPGSFEYLWDDPGNQTTQIAFDLGAGTYNCTVTDSNLCSKITSVQIIEPDTLTLETVINDPSCAGLSDGAIIPTPQGGTGSGYEYIWSNGVYERFNTNLPEGTYVLTMNDANHCTVVDTFSLADPDTLEINSVDITDVSCLGKSDGAVNIVATGGTGILEYSTDNGSNFGTSENIIDLDAGDYVLLVRDENDCVSENYPVVVTISDTVLIDSIRFTDATCNGLNNGSISLVASGGAGNYEYSSDGGTTFVSNATFSSLSAGAYSVMVRDNNECSSEPQSITLVYTDTVKITDVDWTDLTCSGQPDGTITVTASGGSGTYTYSADGGVSFVSESTIGSLPQGDHIVIAKDDNECLSDESTVSLHVTEVCGMTIYDAFSPNADGKNDVWNIPNAENFPNLVVKIFNLWGKEVFSSKGYGIPWDGTFTGNLLPSGTYYYVIDPGDGSDIMTGDVSIVK